MKLIQLTLALFVSVFASAQNWVELKQSGAPFSEVREAFYEEYEGNEELRGRGHKPFHRWEYFMEQRVYPGEYLPPTSHMVNEFYQHGLDRQRTNSAGRTNGTWEPFGLTAWENSGWNPGIGRISAIARHPFSPQILFAGTPSGGLWLSENGGIDWEPLTDQLPTPGVSGIALNQQNPDIMYIGTGDGDAADSYSIGVLKSTDGGQNWETTSLSYNVQDDIRCHKLIIHPFDGSILFAATNQGLYKTENAGLTWVNVRTGNVRDVLFKPGNPDVVYCVTTRFYKSTDGGDSFDLTNSGAPTSSDVTRMQIAVSPADEERVYILAANNEDSGLLGVWRSNDAGDSFELTFNTLNILGYAADGSGVGGQGWYDLDIAVSPVDADRVFTAGINLWESTDGGYNFQNKTFWIYDDFNPSSYVHADIHRLEFFGSDFYVGSDGGIFKSSNFGNSFTDLTPTLQNSQFYRIDVANYDSQRVIGGTQDNGTNLRDLGQWTHVIGADGMEAQLHPSDPSVMYGSTQYGGLNKSVNGGVDFYGIGGNIEEDAAWVTPYVLNPVNPNIMYAGFQSVWRSTDAGENWQSISDFSNSSTIRSLEVSAANPNHIFAATLNTMWKTTNGGGDWEAISQGLPNLSITRVISDPDNAQRLWVTLSGYSDGQKIFETTDGGSSWQNISGNLPNVPTNCMAYNPDNGGMYLGTDFGMYYTNDDLANWQPFNNGLPNTIVQDIDLHFGDQKVTAGTYGRGIWQSDFFTASTEIPEPGLTADRQRVCEGQTVNFADISQFNQPVWSWTFEGGTPSTSDEHLPEIVYDEAGTYDVELTVENENGPATIVLEDFITVFPAASMVSTIEEGFESLSDLMATDEWEVSSTAQLVGWQVTDEAARSGEKSMTIQNHGLDVPHTYEFVSRPIDLSTATNAQLSFAYAFTRMDEDDSDIMTLYFSSDCGQSWNVRDLYNGQFNMVTAEPEEQLAAFFPQGMEEWEVDEVLVTSNYFTDGFMFKLVFENGNGNNLFIDDINLTSTVGIEDLETKTELKVYPNPATETVNISVSQALADQSFITITDATGRQVNRIQLPPFRGEQSITLPVKSWGAGLYHISFSNGQNRTVKRFIKQ